MPASRRTCRRARSRTRISKSSSTRATNGFCSAPASASVTSSTRARPRPTWRKRPQKGRFDRPASLRDDIGFIVVGTTTPDTIFPSTACLLQHKIGAKHAWGFDLGAACSGFLYALTTGMHMVASGAHEHALVVGADVMSSIIDYKDRTTCVLFGDGAGAVVLSAAAPGEPSIIGYEHEIDGAGGPALCMPAGGSRMPASHESVEQRMHYVKQDGQAVFKFAVRKSGEICRRLLDRHGVDPSTARSVRLAPGQPAHHRGGRRASRPPAGEGCHQPRKIRQHDCGHGPPRARGRRAGWTVETGQPRDAGVGRRGVHGRRDAAPLESVRDVTRRPVAAAPLSRLRKVCKAARREPCKLSSTGFAVVR